MSPRNATEINQRRSYVYRGEKYPSVTTLLKTWPMEWAIAYGAKHVALRAMSEEGFARITESLDSPEASIETLKWLKKAPHERRDAAAEAGTIRHGYLEDRLNGLDLPEGALSPAEIAVEQFLAVYRPDPLFVECQVVSITERYAGSADAFVTIYGKRYVLDLKTGANATTDHKSRLQLAAYRYADMLFEDDRDLGPVPMLDGALVLSIPRDDPRSWQLIEVDAGPEVYRRFLDFARAFRFYDAHKDTAVGELLLPQLEEGAA
jgi:hypothetical protein